MIYLLIFILGLCVGSFLNVLIYRETILEHRTKNLEHRTKWRLPDWVTGRSYCDHCRRQLNWYDNIPLLSFVILRGRCRFCHKKISLQYPLVEFLTAVQFTWIYFLISSNLTFFSQFEGFYSLLILLLWLVLGSCFLTIFITDLKYQIIPDTAVIVGLIASLLKLWLDYRYTGMVDFSTIWSGLLSGLFFVTLIIITRGKGMGFGDVKLAVLIGLILGYPKTMIAIFLAFLTGAFISVILILLGIKKLKSKIAFGPFLILGLIITIIYGEKIWLLFF